MEHIVLTGDIVDSSALSAGTLDSVLKTLQAAQTDVSIWLYPAYATFARREGDSWQLALVKPRYGLRAALYARALLRREHEDIETRIAIAQGRGELPAKGDLNAASGPAFTQSGRLLETLKGATQMDHADGGALGAAVALADHISQSWTQAQARALVLMLAPDPGPRSKAAARLGISRQAVDQALHGAGYPALMRALTALETLEPQGAP